MPVDYSKWDNLELSDDSDIEVHPNVDKRSFIRAKQQQIHNERQRRRLQIETYKYERIINDQLLSRVSGLLDGLKARAAEAHDNPDEVAFRHILTSAPKPEDDNPPPRPEGVHANVQEQPSYTKMMMTLLDQVKEKLDEQKPSDRYAAMLEGISEHLSKIQGLQTQLLTELAKLEKEEKSKITSEGIHTGFDSSHVTKSAPSTSGEAKGEKKLELLNPNYDINQSDSKATDPTDDDTEVEASPDARKFAQIKASNYRESHSFLTSHPHILTERETDALLILAFESQLENKEEIARNYVHQALLLQYCRALGKDGVPLFFKRISTKDHKAQEVFYKDVQDTYFKIKSRTAEINKQRAESGNQEGVEQIQLQAVEPGTEIKIRIPPKDSEDEEEIHSREIFESFSPEMQKALESGSLDKVNEALGKLNVTDAEELVGLLSEAAIISVEEQIIDATTEEGRQKMKELEDQAAQDSYADDPE
ncbi:hypothetical protein GGS20DRAFT_114387 [Poronia punctata]|nr:hypothetical protein GGS20DRAFT_114387 [Poronia punctata]